MTKLYACLNYGGCATAGVPRPLQPGLPAICESCGGPMAAQGGSQSHGRLSPIAKYILGLLAVLALIMPVWKIGSWAYHKAAGYELIGKWRAEQTSLLNVNLPVGANLEFTPDSAYVLGSRLAVTEYQKEDDRVHVALAAPEGLQLNLTFRFEDADRMVFEGPLGIALRYRRVREQ